MTQIGLRTRRVGAAIVLAISAVTPFAAADVTVPADPALTPIPGTMEFSGRLIARPWQHNRAQAKPLNAMAAADQDARARDRLAAQVITYVPETDEYVIALPPGRGDAEYTRELSATGDYQYVHPDWICYPQSTPNDPGFPAQFQHTKLQSALAWNITTGTPSIICAFVDTGVDLSHPDLAAHLVPGHNSWDAIDQSAGGDVTDVNGHGTAVVGCAGAIGNNGIGVAGVGWNLSIMPIRASNIPSGSSSLSIITAGARWAATHGARVVSVSYSGVTNPAVQTTGTFVKSNNAVLVWAAGNNGLPLAAGTDWSDVIIIANTDCTDRRNPNSNFGHPIDCAAPGTDVLTTANGGLLEAASGTSFAAPITAGLLGLIYSVNPALTPEQAETILYQGCQMPDNEGGPFEYGAGRINAFRSVWIAAHGPDSPIPTPDAAATPETDGVLIDVLANDADAQNRPLTIASFDSVSALGGMVVLSEGTAPGGRDQLLFIPGTSGADSFTYTLSNGVESSTAAVTIAVVSASSLRLAQAAPNRLAGLKVSYFEFESALLLPDFSSGTPFHSAIWTQVNFPASDDDFAGTFRIDDVAALATGLLVVPTDGFYTLSLESSDGSRLLIGDQVIVNNDGLHGMERVSGLIGLEAGAHPLRIEMFERLQECGLIARIAGPGIPEQIIPASMLAHFIPNPADFNTDGFVDPDDLADFITCFFLDVQFPGFCTQADFNNDGSRDPDDLADFITTFFLF